MGTQLFWFYDAVVVALLLINIYSGGKRGFLKSVVLILGFAASVLVSWIVSSAAAPAVYENFIQEKTTVLIEERLKDVNIAGDLKKLFSREDDGVVFSQNEMEAVLSEENGDLTGAIQKLISNKYADINLSREEVELKLNSLFDNQVNERIFGALPAYMKDPVNAYLNNSEDIVNDVLRALNGTSRSAAEYIEENFIRSGVVTLIRLGIFLIVFSVMMIAIQAISAGTNIVKAIPLASSLNAFLGVLLGVVQGAAVIIIIAVVLKTLICLTGNELIAINSQTIEETYLFKAFYNLIA